MKFVQLILRKKSLKLLPPDVRLLKCTKFDFLAGGDYSAPRTPELDLRGLLLRQGRGRKRGGDERGGDGG